MPAVKSRLVLYFPGFDPLDAAAHHLRYQRAAALAGKVPLDGRTVIMLTGGNTGKAIVKVI